MRFGLVLITSFLQFGIINYGDFSCGFAMISNIMGFDHIFLLLVFLIFEIEIVVVLTLQSLLVVVVICVVTIYELVNVVI